MPTAGSAEPFAHEIGGTVANYATIVGTGGTAVSLAASFTNRMVIGAGAVFTGVVDGGNTIGSATISTLELTTGASAGEVGTLSGIGSKYIDFGNMVVDAGASWVLAGGQTIAANVTLTDNGTLTNNATVLTTVTLGSGASLTNASDGVIRQINGGYGGPRVKPRLGHQLRRDPGWAGRLRRRNCRRSGHQSRRYHQRWMGRAYQWNPRNGYQLRPDRGERR